MENLERLGEIRRAAIAALEGVSSTPALDVDLLLSAVLDVSRSSLYSDPERPLSAGDVEAFKALLSRREAGEPVAYILNRRPFRDIDLYVDRRVLVPRPETEHLVDLALDWLANHPGPRWVVDVGTGSGAIALALADELPADRQDVTILGSEFSRDALEVARENCRRLGLDSRVEFVQSDLLESVPGTFDIILANLPYLRPDQRDPSTVAEPDLALYAGPDGLDLYRRLLSQLPEKLREEGMLAIEIDPDQARCVRTLVLETVGGHVRIERDLAGLDRYLVRDASA